MKQLFLFFICTFSLIQVYSQGGSVGVNLDSYEISGDSLILQLIYVNHDQPQCSDSLTVYTHDGNYKFFVEHQSTFEIITTTDYPDYELSFELYGLCGSADIGTLTVSKISDTFYSSSIGFCNRRTFIHPISTSKGSPLDGPYLPGETVTFDYYLEFDNTQTACQWFHGFVPSLNKGWVDIGEQANEVVEDNFHPFEFFEEGSYLYQSTNSFLSIYNYEGRKHLANIFSENFDVGTVLNNSPMPAGFFINGSNGSGAGCTGTVNPNTQWGDPIDCSSVETYNFLLHFKVRDDINIFDCQDSSLIDLALNINWFADGETGCWVDTKCAGSTPQFVPCQLEAPVMTSLDSVYEASPGEVLVYEVEDPDYKIASWEADVNNKFRDLFPAQRKANDMFIVEYESDTRLEIRFINPSTEEITYDFLFNVVRKDNDNFIFPANIQVNLCGNFIEVPTKINRCTYNESIDFASFSEEATGYELYLQNEAITQDEVNGLPEGQYEIEYIYSSSQGCQNHGNLELEIYSRPNIVLESEEVNCSDLTTEITFSDETMMANSYLVFMGDTIQEGLSFALSDSGDYQIIFDVEGCKDTLDFSYKGVKAIELDLSYADSICPDTKQDVIITNYTDQYEYKLFDQELFESEDLDKSTFSLAAGKYSVNAIDFFGCIKSLELSIEEYEEISFITSSTPDFDNNWGSISFDFSSGKAPFTISNDELGILTTDSMITLPAGDYTFTITDGNGCQTTASETITFISNTNDESNNHIFLTPNPATDRLYINNQGSERIEKILFFNVDGKLVKSLAYQKVIDISTLTNGMYYVVLQSQNRTLNKKMIKQ